jgi:hydroxypyruvate isomerase
MYYLTFQGDVTKGELGFAAIPGAEEKFNDSINLAIKYAKALKYSRYVLVRLVTHTTQENGNI